VYLIKQTVLFALKLAFKDSSNIPQLTCFFSTGTDHYKQKAMQI